MKTFSRVAIATLLMVGVSSAQTKPPAPAPKATPAPAPAPAPKAAPTPAPKAAPTPAPKAAPTPAPAPGQAKTPPGQAKTAPAPAPAMPAPPPELAAMAKTTVGTWRCKGEEFDDKGAKGAMTATSTAKLDLDKWWLVETMTAKGRMPFKMVAYTTYDPTAKKWRRLAVMNGGGYMIGTSDGVKEGKMMWNLDVMGPMGAGIMRDHMDMTDPKAGMKARGEMSMDKGKTWMPVYEMTCKK